MSRFDQKAQDWDTPERQEHARTIAESIRAHVPLTRQMRAIDIGAGTGLLGLALAADVGSMVLAEPSAGMLMVAREKLAASGPANVTAVPFDLPGRAAGWGTLRPRRLTPRPAPHRGHAGGAAFDP